MSCTVEIDGYNVEIDAEDFGRVKRHNWYAVKRIRRSGKEGTVCFRNRDGLLLNRFILGYEGELYVIHKDMNQLNLKKENLIVGDSHVRNRFQKPRAGYSSKYKGVFFSKKERCWISKIYLKDNYWVLGYFENEIDAANAYDEKAFELFGLECYLNFPENFQRDEDKITVVSEGEEKLETRIEEQKALIGQQVQVITELKKQNGELQGMLHGYEQQLNAADDAQNAAIDKLTKVQTALLASQAKERSTRMMLNEQIGENATMASELEVLRAELADVKHQLKEMTAKEFRVRIAFDQQVAENAEMMRELDEYAEMLGNAEQQHDVLKQVAKPLLQQFVNEL